VQFPIRKAAFAVEQTIAMTFRGNLIRRAVPLLVLTGLVAGAFALTAEGASRQSVAAASKKCKKRAHGKKHRCKKRHVTQPASISISPASQDFGVPQIGGETRTFTVTNVGGSPSGLPVPTLMAPDPSDFSIGANGCINLLPPGGGCPIDVHVSTNGAGRESATLTVTAMPGGTVSASVTADIEA
jgi:hypothetical protein